jgi:SAM-dependent methyltransferase
MNDLRKRLFKFYYRVEHLLTPGLRNAQFAYRDILLAKLSSTTLWLDIGCGRRLFPDWMPGAEEAQVDLRARLKTTFGVDPDFASLRDNKFVQNRVAGDSCSLPFADASFDLLTANMVIEHISDPVALLAEVSRVLKPSGIFLFHTPNAHSYSTGLARMVPEKWKAWLIGFFEARKEEDVFPALYQMNTPRRIRELAGTAELRLLELMPVESSAQGVMLGPLVALELLWIRLLRFSAFKNLRSNLIVILQKPA